MLVMIDGHCSGGPHGTSAIYLTVTDSSGSSGRLEYADPNENGCVAPYALFTISLSPDLSTSRIPIKIPINLDYYRPPNLPNGKIGFAPDWRRGGTYTLQAEMANGTVRKNHWEGQGIAASNQLEVRIPPP